MKFKHQNIIITVLLALLFLTACSKTGSKKTANLPTAKTILTKAEKDNFNSMHASWNESANQKTQQKAEAQYTKKPTVIYANVSSNSNHYQMWIEGKKITSKWRVPTHNTGSRLNYLKLVLTAPSPIA